jgi:MoxR-like ATPase
MPSIALDLQRILDLAPQYSWEPTPAMLERAEAAADLADRLRSALEELASPARWGEIDLQVKAGGRQGSFSPLPWVRVYSKRYAPTAQEGTYLVYLFAADGSRVYLSLNQGTSEVRSGHMRPIVDTQVLASRAAQARSELGDLIETVGASNTVTEIDLAGQGLESSDSRERARGYEAANILAYEYRAGQIPSDEQLLGDLSGMLPLLTRLYGVASLQPQIQSLFDTDSLQKLAVNSHNLEIDRHVYRAIIAAITSGKHVILTGPPGTAKTTLAELTCSLAADAGLCPGYLLTTATADWTTYDTIGGLSPTGSAGALQFRAGFFLDAAKSGKWLVVDELNRSNFDRAFGQLFTVLSGQSVVLPYEDPHSGNGIALVLEGAPGGQPYDPADYAILTIPQPWRIIATMNVFDKSLLFEMSFALMRRFAFIEVPSPPVPIYETVWRRELDGLQDEQYGKIDAILSKLLVLRSVKDIGPCGFHRHGKVRPQIRPGGYRGIARGAGVSIVLQLSAPSV